MELSPEEKRRIYAEEKARIEAQDALKTQKEAEEKQKSQGSVNKGFLGCLGVVVLIFLIFLISTLFDSGDRGGSSSSKSPSDAGYVKGLGKDVVREELDQWRAIGLVTSYEFSEQSVVVYLYHSDWISLPSNSKADFKAGIHSKWPDGSVTFRDSQSGERL